MGILINNFSITNSGSSLAIDVETTVGHNITSMLLWNMDSFKDYSLAINLGHKLEQINHKEIFVLTAAELGILKFEDIYFLEIESDAPTPECNTCLLPALGITYSLLPYYACMLEYLLESDNTDCSTCTDLTSKNLLVTLNLLLDSVERSIEIGFYLQAIANVKKLKKLCSIRECIGCKQIQCNSCGQFNQAK
jgi:hypothetical protein